MLRVAALVMVLAMTGCGLTQTRRPDPHHPADQRPECTESFDAPKRDSIGAVLGFVTFLIGVIAYNVEDEDANVGAPLMVGGGVVTVASYVSGGIGYYRVKACQKAIKDFERRYPPPAHPPGVAPRP